MFFWRYPKSVIPVGLESRWTALKINSIIWRPGFISYWVRWHKLISGSTDRYESVETPKAPNFQEVDFFEQESEKVDLTSLLSLVYMVPVGVREKEKSEMAIFRPDPNAKSLHAFSVKVRIKSNAHRRAESAVDWFSFVAFGAIGRFLGKSVLKVEFPQPSEHEGCPRKDRKAKPSYLEIPFSLHRGYFYKLESHSSKIWKIHQIQIAISVQILYQRGI